MLEKVNNLTEEDYYSRIEYVKENYNTIRIMNKNIEIEKTNAINIKNLNINK